MTLSHAGTISPGGSDANRSRLERHRTVALLALLAAAAAIAGCGGSGQDGAEESPGSTAGSVSPFDAERAFEDLVAQVEIGPRPAGSPGARKTARFIARSLREAGVAEIRTARPHRNVSGLIEGRGGEGGEILVAAHYDTVEGIPDFEGANDGASGVAVVLEIARVLAADDRGPVRDVRLVLFDAEEARPGRSFDVDGTRGSRQYASRVDDPSRIEAMILFDLVGDCDLQIPREQQSDPELYGEIAAYAGEIGFGEVFSGEGVLVLDDHVPFLRLGIPAVDLIDFTYGPGRSPGAFWHTSEDTLDKVCPESLAAAGSPVTNYLLGINPP